MPRNANLVVPQFTISEDYRPDAQVIFHHGDATKYLATLPNDSISLIVTSPPYNIGKLYEKKTSIKNYLQAQEKIIAELCRVLTPSGSICWQVGNYVEKGEVFPLDIFYYDIFKKKNMILRNRIIWRYGHGLHATRRLSGRYETILWFTKGDSYTFNLDEIRVPSKYPGKRYSKGPKKGKPSGNPKGKNPSDYWEILVRDWEEEIWDIPNVKANHPEKTEHPCQFPVELVERCVLALSNPQEWVLDPFAGVGSGLIAAIKHDRKAMGCEKSKKYVTLARRRVLNFANGNLKTRALDKPLHEPKPTDKVATVPSEWQRSEDSIYNDHGKRQGR